MIFLVSDTSVMIDLDRGNLLDAIFSLPYRFAVPDVLYVQEMAGPWGERLREQGIQVEEVPPSGVSRALQHRSVKPGISVPDSFALALAEERGWTLLTGDGLLRELAGEHGVPCHGVLWLIDRMEEHGVPGILGLHAGLSAIAEHRRCRLPRREISLRLERYKTLLKRP